MFEPRELSLAAVILRVLIAVILGGAIGLERGLKNRPAGLRTYMLVCTGACIVMLTNQYAFQVYAVGDPVRMGAQVVSGIGFLGAGTIMVTSRSRIRGLTTAAGLWAAGCVGLAIGIGFYEVALVGSAAIVLVLTLLHIWDKAMRRRMRRMEIYVELAPEVSLGQFLRSTREARVELSNLRLEEEWRMSGGGLAFLATVKAPQRGQHELLLDCVRRLPGVECTEEIS